MDLLTFLVLLRVPILNNHALNWVALLTISWLIADKLKLQVNSKLLNGAIRITTALVAVGFLAGLAEIMFDPFWILKAHMSLGTYLGNIVYANFFYTGLLFGVAFFKFKRIWLVALPLLVGLTWFVGGFHMPAGMYLGDTGYYYDFAANLFDIAEQVTSFIAGYYMISGLRLIPILERKKEK
jgi:hypothetical protein